MSEEGIEGREPKIQKRRHRSKNITLFVKNVSLFSAPSNKWRETDRGSVGQSNKDYK